MNLSSAQWFNQLDNIIYDAFAHLLEQTNIVEHYVSQLILYQNHHKKRKVSTVLNWDEFISRAIHFLGHPCIENFKKLSLDRSFSLSMLHNFQNLTSRYEAEHTTAFRSVKLRLTLTGLVLDRYHRIVGSKRHDILSLVYHVRAAFTACLQVKHEILRNYEAYLNKTAFYDYQNSLLPIDLEDLRQNYWVAANKAVDHFDLNKGSFKSYLDVWVKKARNQPTHFLGSAYSIPSGVQANHLYVPIDDTVAETVLDETPSAFDIVAQNQESEILLALARLVDPEGYAITSFELGTENHL